MSVCAEVSSKQVPLGEGRWEEGIRGESGERRVGRTFGVSRRVGSAVVGGMCVSVSERREQGRERERERVMGGGMGMGMDGGERAREGQSLIEFEDGRTLRFVGDIQHARVVSKGTVR